VLGSGNDKTMNYVGRKKNRVKEKRKGTKERNGK